MAIPSNDRSLDQYEPERRHDINTTRNGLERAPVDPTYTPCPPRLLGPDTPGWFHRATARRGEPGVVQVAGSSVRFLRWDGGPGPATVLVHGGGAHAHWWAPLAPGLPDRSGGPVVALDLSGHGVSDRRDSYDMQCWTEEAGAVVGAHADGGPVTVIGHSMGGIIAANLALETGPPDLGHVVAVDAPLWPDPPVPDVPSPSRRRRSARRFESPDSAVERLRLIPPQRCATRWYPAYIAWHGLVEQPPGWRWRVDPGVFAAGDEASVQMARFPGTVDDISCRVSMLMGSESYLLPAALSCLSPPRAAALTVVPGAAHHVMLDSPEALTLALLPLVGRGADQS